MFKKGCTFTSQTTTIMENIAKTLENKQILIINAETLVNGKTNKSRISNKSISLGLIKKDYFITNLDGSNSTYFAQFEIIVIDGKEFKPVFSKNQIFLYAQSNRVKNIDIIEFKVI
jgi:hypothetical protein